MITYKALHCRAPSYIVDLIEVYHPPRALRSEDAGFLVTRRVFKSRTGGRSFSYLPLYSGTISQLRSGGQTPLAYLRVD